MPDNAGMTEGLVTFSDQPVRRLSQDRLRYAPYVGVFSEFLLHPETSTPLTMAVSGPWGSGKTTLAGMLDTTLRERDGWIARWSGPPLVCWFNAWHHADADKVGVALAARVARVLAPRRAPWWRVLEPLPASLLPPARRWARRLWQGVGGAVLLLTALVLLCWRLPSLRAKLGPVGRLAAHGITPLAFATVAAGLLAVVSRAFQLGGSLGSYLESPGEAAAQGSMAEVRDHLGRLVRQALRQGRPSSRWRRLTRQTTAPRERPSRRRRRLVVIIDDLERCPADKALGLCEVVSQLLDHPGVIVLLVSDLAPVAAAAAARYAQDGGSVPPAVLGNRYLDKLIHLRFNLPPLSATAVRALFEEDEPGDGRRDGRWDGEPGR